MVTDGRDEKYGERRRPQDRLSRNGEISSWSFWESLTIGELARLQKVSPIEDISLLFGTWPGEPDDGFEEAVDGLRHRYVLGGKGDE